MTKNADNRRSGIARQVWLAGGAGFVVVFIATIDLDLFRASLATRVAVAAVGLAPIAVLLTKLARRDGRRRQLFWTVVALHVLATFFFFPAEALVNERPLISVDHSYHYYQALQARTVFWDTYRIDHYDPYFMAGYPGGTIFDLDMKGAEIFTIFTSFLSVARSLKLFVFLTYMLMVLSVFVGSRLLGFRWEEAMIGLLIFLAYWHWGRPYAGVFRFAGMFSFVFVSHLCLLLTGLFRAFLGGQWVKTFFVVGPLVFLVHPTAAVILPGPFLAVALAERSRVEAARRVQFVAWCAVVVVVNSIWLWPFFEYLWIKTTTQLYYQIEGWRGLVRVLWKPSCAIALATLGLGAMGAWHLFRHGRATVAAPPLTGATISLLAGGFGVYVWGINQLEPGRFLFTLFVFLAPLAGAASVWLIDRAGAALGGGNWSIRLRVLVVVSLALSLVPLSLFESKSFYRHTVSTRFTPRIEGLIAALEQHTDPGGRLMIEEGHATVYDGTYLPSLLPLHTGVEQIGGPYPHTFLLFHFASFQWQRTFGQPLSKWTDELFRRYLDMYGIRWVLTATEKTAAHVAPMLDGEPVWTDGRFRLWEVETGYTGDGDVTVRAGLNRIEVAVSGSESGYLLRYHWVEGLSVTPPAVISPRARLADPVPFIYVEPRGAKEVVIRY